MFHLFSTAANAMAKAPVKGGAQQANGIMAFMPFIIIIGVFYLIVFLPQKKEKKRRETMLSNIKPGDEILTTSGIYGKIVKLETDYVMIRVNDNGMQLKILRNSVSIVLEKPNKDDNKKVIENKKK